MTTHSARGLMTLVKTAHGSNFFLRNNAGVLGWGSNPLPCAQLENFTNPATEDSLLSFWTHLLMSVESAELVKQLTSYMF